MESLHAAINAGADAVYFGVGVLNMRARSSVNFTLDDLAEIVRIAHEAGVKTYLTVNTILYDNEMEDLRAIVDRAVKEGVDAIIAADVAAIMYARQVGMEVHISTQCNISNIEAVRFYAQWADVVVLARELSLEQIAYISECIKREEIRGPKGELVQIEMFAHGALCMSISGKCYLSEHEEN
jgi:putative protease